MRIRMIILLVVCMVIVPTLKSQDYDYDFAVGARIGLAYGINAKYFLRIHPAVQAHTALEGMVTHRYKGLNGTVLLEYHIEIFDTQGFNLYIGGGAHFAVWNSDVVDWETEKHGNNLYSGLDGVVGLEYVFTDLPVSFGLDWKPSVNFISDFNLMIDDIALSVRFLFK